jgi:hypothetical protein
MTRTMDTTEVPGDEGMAETGPRKRLNASGQSLVKSLQGRGVALTERPEQDAIRIESLADFITAATAIGRAAGTPTIEFGLTETSPEELQTRGGLPSRRLSYAVPDRSEPVSLVLEGETVDYLLASGQLTDDEHGCKSYQAAQPVDYRPILAQMAAADPTLAH